MKERVMQYWEAYARGDLEGGLALMSDDIVFTISGTAPAHMTQDTCGK
jgi:ketosteroid isomerase-like protein